MKLNKWFAHHWTLNLTAGILSACGWAYLCWSSGRYGEDSAWPAWTIQGDWSLLCLLITTEVHQLCPHRLPLADIICRRQREWVAWKGGNRGPLGLLLPEDASKSNEGAGEAWREFELTRRSRCREADRLVRHHGCNSTRHHCTFLLFLCLIGGGGVWCRWRRQTSRLLHGKMRRSDGYRVWGRQNWYFC